MIKILISELINSMDFTCCNLVNPDLLFTGEIKFDSRDINPGDIFLALHGKYFDGYQFSQQAIDKGAIAILAARPIPNIATIFPKHYKKLPENINQRYLYSTDINGENYQVIYGLNLLAASIVAKLRQKNNLKIVAITGSAGKTSTKDITKTILKSAGVTIAPPGSYNNELGVLWTILKCDENTRYLILELGARFKGDIATQVNLVSPDIAAVVSLGKAHLENFTSESQIIAAKAEILSKLRVSDTAVLAVKNDYMQKLVQASAANLIKVGFDSNNDIYASDISVDLTYTSFRINFNPNCITKYKISLNNFNIKIPYVGYHMISNTLVAIGISLSLGLTIDEIKIGLNNLKHISPHRMQIINEFKFPTIIDDTYNANPESVIMALKTLATNAISKQKTANHSIKTWAILGEMLELGSESIKLHDDIGRYVVRLNIDKLICVGDTRNIKAMELGAIMEGSWGSEVIRVDDNIQALDILLKEVKSEDLILFKASNSIKLWTLIKDFMEHYK